MITQLTYLVTLLLTCASLYTATLATCEPLKIGIPLPLTGANAAPAQDMRHKSKFMPWQVAHKEQFETKADALKRERQIKKWSRTKKEALVAGDMVSLKELAKRRKF